jgi:hypothetical protein
MKCEEVENIFWECLALERRGDPLLEAVVDWEVEG